VDEHGLALEGLHQVRLERVLHDHRHRTGHPEILGRDRLARTALRHHDPAEARTQVVQIAREGEDRHDLRCGRDDERALAGDPVGPTPEAHDRVPQLAIVDIERPRPRDRRGVDVERVAVVERCIERGRQEVVRRGHGMEVAVEVQVDVLHRDDLGVAAAVPPALDAEHRTHRRLPQAEHDALADLPEPLREGDRRRGLALARFGRRDRGGDDELAVGPGGQPIQQGQVDLRAVCPVLLELSGLDAHGLRDLRDGAKHGFLRDLESALHRPP
jgi:hypothetical protein